MEIKAVFIDIDDTLLSFEGYVRDAMRSGFTHFGLKPYEDSMFDIFHRVNGGLWRQIEQGTLTFDELQKIRWNRIFEALSIAFDGPVFEKYFREFLFSSAIPEPHAHELLEFLAARYTLCAASNGPYEQQLNRLRVGGMYNHFRHFFISSKIGAMKPSREFFDRCFAELRASGFPNLLPQETIMIGDSLTSDMAGGKQFGMQTCLYSKVSHTAEELEGITYTVSSLREIMEIL